MIRSPRLEATTILWAKRGVCMYVWMNVWIYECLNVWMYECMYAACMYVPLPLFFWKKEQDDAKRIFEGISSSIFNNSGLNSQHPNQAVSTVLCHASVFHPAPLPQLQSPSCSSAWPFWPEQCQHLVCWDWNWFQKMDTDDFGESGKVQYMPEIPWIPIKSHENYGLGYHFSSHRQAFFGASGGCGISPEENPLENTHTHIYIYTRVYIYTHMNMHIYIYIFICIHNICI